LRVGLAGAPGAELGAAAMHESAAAPIIIILTIMS
jgi:hypothetical protein